MRLLLPNGGAVDCPPAPRRHVMRGEAQKTRSDFNQTKSDLVFWGSHLVFPKSRFLFPRRPCPGFCSARVCLLRALSPAGCGCAIARTAQSEGVADGQMIGQRVLEARHVVPSALTRVVRRVKGNAHVETDDQKVEVVAQAYAGAYGNVFQVFQ